MKLNRRQWLGAIALLFPTVMLQPGAPKALGVAPPAAEMKLERVLPSDADQAWRVVLSTDGKKVVTGYYGPRAILWDAASGKPLQFLQGHDGKILSVAISADGKQVVTGSDDKTAILWDAVTGKKLQTIEPYGVVHSVALSADGKHVATGSHHAAILWDAATGKKLHLFGENIGAMALSADGKRLVTTSGELAMIWDTATGKKLRTFEGHTSGISRPTISIDGNQVITVDNNAILWEAATGKIRQTFKVGPDNWIQSVALSPDCDEVFAGCWDRTAILWDAATGKRRQTFLGHTNMVLGVALSADGKHAWTASFDGTTRLWETASGKELCALLSFEAGKDWLAVTPEGFFDGSQGAWKRLAFREPATGKVLNDDATRRKFHRPGLLGAVTEVRNRSRNAPITDAGECPGDMAIKIRELAGYA